MSILEVEILLHYYACSRDYRDLDAPAIDQAIKNFCKIGIMSVSNVAGVKYEIDRDAIKPYIDAVTSIPLPIKTYIIPKYEINNY